MVIGRQRLSRFFYFTIFPPPPFLSTCSNGGRRNGVSDLCILVVWLFLCHFSLVHLVQNHSIKTVIITHPPTHIMYHHHHHLHPPTSSPSSLSSSPSSPLPRSRLSSPQYIPYPQRARIHTSSPFSPLPSMLHQLPRRFQGFERACSLDTRKIGTRTSAECESPRIWLAI